VPKSTNESGRITTLGPIRGYFLGQLFRVHLIQPISKSPSIRLYARMSVRPQKVSSISMKIGT